MTSAELKPKTCAAMIAPKVNTAARPSRNTALASRNSSTFGLFFARLRTVRQSFA